MKYTLISEGGNAVVDGVTLHSLVDCGSHEANYALFAGKCKFIQLTEKNLSFHGTDIIVKNKK